MTEAIDLIIWSMRRSQRVGKKYESQSITSKFYYIKNWNLSLLSNDVRGRERARESLETCSFIAPLHRL